MNCSKCGNKINDGDIFCSVCGKPIEERNEVNNIPVKDNTVYPVNNNVYHPINENSTLQKMKSDIKRELTDEKKKKLSRIFNMTAIILCIFSIWGIQGSIVNAIEQDTGYYDYLIILLLLAANMLALAVYGTYKITNICYVVLDCILIGQYINIKYITDRIPIEMGTKDMMVAIVTVGVLSIALKIIATKKGGYIKGKAKDWTLVNDRIRNMILIKNKMKELVILLLLAVHILYLFIFVYYAVKSEISYPIINLNTIAYFLLSLYFFSMYMDISGKKLVKNLMLRLFTAIIGYAMLFTEQLIHHNYSLSGLIQSWNYDLFIYPVSYLTPLVLMVYFTYVALRSYTYNNTKLTIMNNYNIHNAIALGISLLHAAGIIAIMRFSIAHEGIRRSLYMLSFKVYYCYGLDFATYICLAIYFYCLIRDWKETRSDKARID